MLLVGMWKVLGLKYVWDYVTPQKKKNSLQNMQNK